MEMKQDYQIIRVSEFGSYILVKGGFETAKNALHFLDGMLKMFQDAETLRPKYRIASVETKYYIADEIE